MRVAMGAVAAVAVGFLGGLIMGEYQLLGVMALLAGVLFGLAVAEAAITVGKSSEWRLAVVAGVSAFAGITWAAYIDAGDGLSRIAGARWAGSALALISAIAWVRTLGSRATHTPIASESQ